MSTLLLAWRWLTQRPTRAVLTGAAIAAAVALLVFTLDTWRATANASEAFAREVLGPYAVLVEPRVATNPRISARVEATIRSHPAVLAVDRGRVHYGDVRDVRDTTYYDAWRAAFLGTSAPEPPAPLAAGRWIDVAADALEAVVAGGLAHRWQVAVGDALPVETGGGAFTVTIVGVTAEAVAHPRASGLWVSEATLARLAGAQPLVDRLSVRLAPGSDAAALVAAWSEPLAAADPAAIPRDLAAFAKDLADDKVFANLRRMAGAGAGLALLAAAFIIAAASSAGIQERTRQLALLRAVGANRGQVVAMVLAEAGLLAFLAGLSGLLLGWLAGLGLGLAQPTLFPTGVRPTATGAMVGLMVGVGLALLAALVPALLAARRAPLEAVTPIPVAAARGRGPWLSVGLVAMAGAGGLAWFGPTAPTVAGVGVGLLLGAGLALALPLAIAAEGILAPLLSRLGGFPACLLGQQLTRARGRTLATLATLTVCLGGSVTMNVWGRTMVVPFLPSPDLPDVIVSIRPAGVDEATVERLRALPGLASERVLAMAVDQVYLGPSYLARVGDVEDATVLIVGINPQAALAGADPLLPLVLDQGDTATAIAALKTPGAALVPPSFADDWGLRLGDQLPFLPRPDSETSAVTIAGLASLPGWHWVTKLGQMRSLAGKPLAPVLVSRATARALGVGAVRHLYADLAPGGDRNQVRRGATEVVAAALARELPQSERVAVKVVETGSVAERLQARADAVIWVIGALPLATLALALLGVVNAVSAGIRARSWELGILRTVGLEGRGLVGLIVAEALVLGVAAAVVSLIGGLVLARLAVGPSISAFGAGGAVPALVVPWLDLAVATVVTIAATLVSALIPARSLAGREPLALLQAGRGG